MQPKLSLPEQVKLIRTLHTNEVAAGDRFEFGKNWLSFAQRLNETRVNEATTALANFLGVQDLKGKTFLDIGSGSGLSSLAAYRLGAQVHSMDIDNDAITCTTEVRERCAPGDARWLISQGSVLEANTLPKQNWDVVYSWGVLHHTGSMWKALENAAAMVSPGGKLFIAIYNDQHWVSRIWLRVKKAYCALPKALRWTVLGPACAVLWGPRLLIDTFSHGNPLKTWNEYSQHSQRGMSPWHDVVDWVGGLPFEVASPEAIFDFHSDLGFDLIKMSTCGGGLGCNQFVFEKRRVGAR